FLDIAAAQGEAEIHRKRASPNILIGTRAVIPCSARPEQVFTKADWKSFLSISMICFVLSVVSFTLSALGIVRSIRTPLELPSGLVRLTGFSFLIGLSTFVAGIIGVAAFAVLNLLKGE